MIASSEDAWAELEWSAHTYRTPAGRRQMSYVDLGTGPVVVFVHGLGGSWQTWLRNLPELSHRHRVIAVDLPGFGRSPALPAPVEMLDFVEALIGLLDHLSLDDVVIVGHSMGGLVSLQLAELHPERVRGLVLADAGGVRLGRGRLALIVGGFRVFDAVFRRPGVPQAVARKPRLRRMLLTPAVRDWRTVSAGLAAEIIPPMSSPGFLPAMRGAARAVGLVHPGNVSCPTLLIWGRQDRILPVARARELAAALPDARLAILDDVAHCPMFEAPEAFNALVEDFLAGRRPPVLPAIPSARRGRLPARRARGVARV